MKNIVKLLGIAALVAIIGFSTAACDTDIGGGGGLTDGGDKDLSGSIAITPNSGVVTGTELTAVTAETKP